MSAAPTARAYPTSFPVPGGPSLSPIGASPTAPTVVKVAPLSPRRNAASAASTVRVIPLPSQGIPGGPSLSPQGAMAAGADFKSMPVRATAASEADVLMAARQADSIKKQFALGLVSEYALLRLRIGSDGVEYKGYIPNLLNTSGYFIKLGPQMYRLASEGRRVSITPDATRPVGESKAGLDIIWQAMNENDGDVEVGARIDALTLYYAIHYANLFEVWNTGNETFRIALFNNLWVQLHKIFSQARVEEKMREIEAFSDVWMILDNLRKENPTYKDRSSRLSLPDIEKELKELYLGELRTRELSEALVGGPVQAAASAGVPSVPPGSF